MGVAGREPGSETQLALILRERRRTQRARQVEVAAEIGVAQQTIAKWERGEAFPADEHLPAVAAYLGLPVEEVQALGRPALRLVEAGDERDQLTQPQRAVVESIAARIRTGDAVSRTEAELFGRLLDAVGLE